MSFLTLYFLHAPGCEACEKALPELEKFEKKRPEVLVIRLNIAAHNWNLYGTRITGTPTYVVTNGKEVIAKAEGKRSVAELNKWIPKI